VSEKRELFGLNFSLDSFRNLISGCCLYRVKPLAQEEPGPIRRDSACKTPFLWTVWWRQKEPRNWHFSLFIAENMARVAEQRWRVPDPRLLRRLAKHFAAPRTKATSGGCTSKTVILQSFIELLR
jgi:hypothetical protein